MYRKKGFTLVELLAVIFLLGLIAIIAIPPIIEQIRLSSKEISKATEDLIFSATDSYIDEHKNEYLLADNDVYCIQLKTLIENDKLIENLTDIKTGNKIDTGKVVKVEVENAANKEYNIVDLNQCTEKKAKIQYVDKSGANPPIIVTGMIPIKWDGTNWVETDINDPYWYDYSSKYWANAKTKDGSMWVWIPRYAYSITSGYHTNTAGTIEIKFLKDKTNISTDGMAVDLTPTYTGDKQTNYVKHPAFKFGNDEIKGFWVAKFEPSVSDQKKECYINESEANCNDTSLVPKIIPNAKSWRYITIGNSFDVSLNMKNNDLVYGWKNNEIDTHMMKNDEWGAVTYLSKSKYGANNVVWINNSSTYTTGCAGNSASASSYSGCQNQYHTSNGQKASTTHNIYGIYDMSGGSWERVTAYVDNGSYNLTTYGKNIIEADAKYKNVYLKGTSDTLSSNYLANKNAFGDNIYETSLNGSSDNGSWYGNSAYMPHSINPWFNRGGGYSGSTYTGIFYYSYYYGGVGADNTFRPVVTPIS